MSAFSQRVSKGLTPALRQKITEVAQHLGVDPLDLATVIGYETIGTFSPAKIGGAGNRYAGLIQFGPHERKVYGVTTKQDAITQMDAVERYLRDRGIKPGMGLLDLYSTINAGRPGKYNAKDASGKTVRQHVAEMQKVVTPAVQTVYQAMDVPTPRPRPERVAALTREDMPAGSLPAARAPAPDTLTKQDMNAGPLVSNMGVMGVDSRMPPAGDPVQQGAIPPPAAPNIAPSEYGRFQARLQAGDIPWSELPPAWQQTLAQHIGPGAEEAYNAATGQVQRTLVAGREERPGALPAAPGQPRRPDDWEVQSIADAAAAMDRQAPAPDAATARTAMLLPRTADIIPAPAEARTKDDTAPPAPAATMIAERPDAPLGALAAATAMATGETIPTPAEARTKDDTVLAFAPEAAPPTTVDVPTPQPRPARTVEAVAPPAVPRQTDITPPASAAAPPPTTRTPTKRQPAVPPEVAKAAWERLKPAVGGLLGNIAKILIPGASKFSQGWPVQGVPGISSISGPGPFSKGNVGSYLASQSWRGPNFDPVSGGSKYSYFVDNKTGTGGYRTQDGRVYTYPLGSAGVF